MVGFGSLYLVWFSNLLSHFNLAYPEGRSGLRGTLAHMGVGLGFSKYFNKRRQLRRLPT